MGEGDAGKRSGMKIHQCLIAGGGPSGLVLALLLKRAGMEPLVLERRERPVKKACGGGITPRALKLIKSLGLDLDTGRDWFALEGNAPPRHINRFMAKKPVMAVNRRAAFQKSLEELVEKSSIPIIRAHITRAAYSGGVFSIETEAGIFRSLRLIGADGAGSRVRRSFGGKVPYSATAMMVDNVSCRKASGRVIFDGGAAPLGYGWVFPYDDETCNCGVYTVGNLPEGGLRPFLARYLKDRLGFDLNGLAVTGGSIPFGGYSLASDAPVLLLGDAGGFADPMTGEGIYHALCTARAASRAILSGPPESVRRRYEKTLRPFAANARFLAWLAPRAYRYPEQGGRLLSLKILHGPITEGLIRGRNTASILGLYPLFLGLSILSPSLESVKYGRHLK